MQLSISYNIKHVVLLAFIFLGVGLIVLRSYQLVTLHNKFSVKNNHPAINFYDKEYTKQVLPTLTLAPTIAQSTESAQLKIPILMYHYVEYVQDPGDTTRKSLDIIPAEFERQLQYLQEKGYKTLFVKDIPFYLQNPQLLPAKPIILTFDDGYRDFYLDAFPLLKKYKMQATIYVINDFIGEKDFLTKEQIEELVASHLVELGAHTLDHINLKYSHTDLARRQITDSKKELEEMFHTPVDTFAYPYGGFTPETEELVKEASFSAAVTVDPGTIHAKNTLFELTRIRAGAIIGDINRMQLLP